MVWEVAVLGGSFGGFLGKVGSEMKVGASVRTRNDRRGVREVVEETWRQDAFWTMGGVPVHSASPGGEVVLMGKRASQCCGGENCSWLWMQSSMPDSGGSGKMTMHNHNFSLKYFFFSV